VPCRGLGSAWYAEHPAIAGETQAGRWRWFDRAGTLRKRRKAIEQEVIPMKHSRVLGLGALVIATGLWCAWRPAPSTTPSGRQDEHAIAGSWTRNAAQSDDPQEELQKAFQDADRAASGVARRPSRRGAASGGGIRIDDRERVVGVSAEQMQRIHQIMQRSSRVAPQLQITMTDSTVTLVTGRDERTMFTDEREVSGMTPLGVEAKVKCKWDGKKLKVETEYDGGVKVTEEYEKKDSQLRVSRRVENTRPRMRANINTVYDAAG
jgi:hypothetical protein